MTKVLFIAHYFPPIGGAGVQRTTKFVKHLPAFGIEPLILTGTGSSTNRWTPKELSLTKDLPEGLEVFRCEWEANRDRRIEMLVEEGARIIEKHKPTVILVTMSPFTDALIAAELSKKFGIPWIADLRDPWALDEIQVYRSRWHRQRELKIMHDRLETADKVIMNTPEAGRLFKKTFPDLAEKIVESITNGFDADDFKGPDPGRDDDIFRIVHTGYLHTEQGLKLLSGRWINRLLGRTTAGVDSLTRSHFFLMKALERWLVDEPVIADKVRLILAGVTSEQDRMIVEQSSAKCLVEFRDFVPHDESLALVRSADLLFLPMHTVAGGKRATIVPGKTYEYIASGRPILATVPEGDAKDFLKDSGNAYLCNPADVEGMIVALKDAFKNHRNRIPVSFDVRMSKIRKFERVSLSANLAKEIIDSASSGLMS